MTREQWIALKPGDKVITKGTGVWKKAGIILPVVLFYYSNGKPDPEVIAFDCKEVEPIEASFNNPVILKDKKIFGAGLRTANNTYHEQYDLYLPIIEEIRSRFANIE